MNILSKFTIKNLKKSRSRTIVTIIGIILSTALIMAITTFVSSFQGFIKDYAEYNYGDWFISLKNADSEHANNVINYEGYSDFSKAESIGYAIAPDCKNADKPYIYFMGADEAFLKNMPIHITSGRMPENNREIILPQHLYSNGGVYYELGDEVSWSVGYRTATGDERLWQDIPYSFGEYTETKIETGTEVKTESELEKLEGCTQMTFTIVGFYERGTFELFYAPGYTAITKADLSDIDADSESVYSLYFKAEPKQVFDECERLEKIIGTIDTQMYLETNGSLMDAYLVSPHESYNRALFSIAAILIVIIMVGAVMLIYNAFAISVSERTKQFGLLSSVGATRKQTGKTVIFEALVLSIAGIVLGVLLGIGGVAVTLAVLQPVFKSVFSMPIAIRLSVSWGALLTAVIIALVTVLISALIPAVRAMRVTAIEAIRQNNDYKITGKQVKTSKLVGKLFGFEGTLASKYFKRNKKKYRVTIFSLFVSIVLFISVSSFSSYLMNTVGEAYEGANFEVVMHVYGNETVDDKKLFKEVLSLPDVSDVTAVRNFYGYEMNVSANKDIIDREYYEWLENTMPDEMSAPALLLIIDDESMRQYCEKNHLNADLYTNPDKPLCIGGDNVRGWDVEEERYRNFHVVNQNAKSIIISRYEPQGDFEKDNAQDSEKDKYTFEIGFYSDELAPGCGDRYNMKIMISQKVADAIGINAGSDISYYINTDEHAKVVKAIEKMEDEMVQDGLQYSVFDIVEQDEENANMLLILKVFAYGFIIMISLISITNVFNTISTNVMLRRKEFAMLKTVGMTKQGFNKMMNFECILYGCKAVLYGLPVSILVSYFIYSNFDSAFEFNFYVPVSSILIAVGAVFMVVFVTMLYSMYKIKKENIIDVLKNENF